MSKLTACDPSTTRSGRTAITADPGAPPVQAIVSPPSVWKVPGSTILPDKRLLWPDEAGDEAIGRLLIERTLRTDLSHRSFRHHDHPVGHDQRFLLVMRDHHRLTPVAAAIGEFDAHGLAQLGIQVRQRLVQEQHVRARDQRASQRHTLLWPARQLSWQPIREPGKPDHLQSFGNPGLGGALRNAAHLQSKGDILANRQMRKQRIALEHHAGVATPGRHSRDIALVEAHLAAGRRHEARDHTTSVWSSRSHG